MQTNTIIKAILILLLTSSLFAADEDQSTFLTKIGQDCPPISFKTVEGKTITPASIKGKVVLINFFANWCPPCKKEMPFLEKDIWQQFKDNENFLIFSVGREHTIDVVKAFQKKMKLTYPLAADPKRKNFALFATQNIPRNYIIGKDGKIVFQESGFDGETINKLLTVIKAELEKN